MVRAPYEKRIPLLEFRWFKPLYGEKVLQQKWRVNYYDPAPSWREDHLIRSDVDWFDVPTEQEEIPF